MSFKQHWWPSSYTHALTNSNNKRIAVIIACVANLMEFCLFCFPALFQGGLCRPSLLPTFYFKWSVFWEKTGFHTYCQFFSFLIPPIFIFSIIIIFIPHHLSDVLTLMLTLCVCLYVSVGYERLCFAKKRKEAQPKVTCVNGIVTLVWDI